jgi:predicted amidophosphoribosyltransferase
VRDRHLILVDDVFTSGATAGACAKALKRAGAARVDVLCWARVLREEQDLH